MEKTKLNRTITTAMHLASAHGIENPSHIDQVIGVMARKLADGLPDSEIYAIGNTVAGDLANQEMRSEAINSLIQQIQLTGNPLTKAQALC